MCGIAGIVAPEVRRHRAAAERMVQSLRHRGPDGEGLHEFGNCALGHTRLSIVDLVSGDQPMLSADGEVAITFNGEIFGYRDIRKRLSESFQFHTTSDTEVILALYQKHGATLAQHLPGQFAFAIWDDAKQTLFVARDRFGEKPFYYAWSDRGEFVFASEIKSLIASGLIRPVLDKKSLAHFLKHLYVHPQQTIYSNVFTLPPAHCLALKDGKVFVERYWTLPQTKEPLSEQEAVEEFRRLFEQSVANQLIADVPVGAFLSGGLDSSSVVAAASRNRSGLRTYSFGFADSVNELPYARQIAQLYGTDHVELEDEHLDIADLLVIMAQIYDEPFADSSNIPTYLISRAARRYGKVVLTGDGGDELLAGYDFWYRPLWEMEASRDYSKAAMSLLRWTTRGFRSLRLSPPLKWQQMIHGDRLRARHGSIAGAHLAQNVFLNDDELHDLTLNGFGGTRLSPASIATLTDTVDDALRMDLLDYMPGDILVKTDRASMAHGLELRAPFLDVDFASFCISLPSRLKIRADEDKWILRRCYSDAWTDEIRRRGKWGFGAPVSQWLTRDSVAALKKRVLDDRGHPLFTLIPFDASRQFVAKDDYQTWILLTLGMWLEQGRESFL